MAMANCNMCGVWVDLDYADGYTEIAGQFVCEDCVLEMEDAHKPLERWGLELEEEDTDER